MGLIQNKVQALLTLEELHVVAMLAQLYYLLFDILKPKKNLIRLDMEEFIIAYTLKFLVVAIIGF